MINSKNIRTLLRKNLVIVQQGFTMIELLVVISVIGILAALSLVSFTGSQKQARDTQRKSDIKQYQTSLEQFASKNNGIYILNTTPVNAFSLCNMLTGSSSCPTDPKPPATYSYCSDSTASQYALWATLENQANTYWIVCSNGKVGSATSIPSCGGSFSCLP